MKALIVCRPKATRIWPLEFSLQHSNGSDSSPYTMYAARRRVNISFDISTLQSPARKIRALESSYGTRPGRPAALSSSRSGA